VTCSHQASFKQTTSFKSWEALHNNTQITFYSGQAKRGCSATEGRVASISQHARDPAVPLHDDDGVQVDHYRRNKLQLPDTLSRLRPQLACRVISTDLFA